MRRLLLFDVDATLILTGGAGARAMTQAFEELFGVSAAFAGIPMAGRTDPAIFVDALHRVGRRLEPGALERFRETYCRRLRVEIDKPAPGKVLMPGIRPLLDALSQRTDVFVALLTGNFAEGARIKLEHFDLWRYFACGAFGDDHAERAALVPIARTRAGGQGAGQVCDDRVFVVGDTPLDVACALASGVRAVAVATGSYDMDALAASGAHVVFPDLSDTASVLAAFGLDG
jgi:phosphoglycolate phosphatase